MVKNSRILTSPYKNAFIFEYGNLDDNTIWLLTPNQKVLNIDQFTLKVILDLNNGTKVDVISKKYDLSMEEIQAILDKLSLENVITETNNGRIVMSQHNDTVDLAPILSLCVVMLFIQIEYFRNIAHTFIMKSFVDSMIVAVLAIVVVFFHELGHYLACIKHFKPKFGFMFVSIFPTIYVDTNLSWTLSKSIRILINLSGAFFDLIVNTILILLVILVPNLEYFVTPLLMLQYSRLLIVLNPLLPGDGYWIVSDLWNKVNLKQKSLRELLSFRFNFMSVFGFVSFAMMILPMIFFGIYIFNLIHSFIQKLGLL